MSGAGSVSKQIAAMKDGDSTAVNWLFHRYLPQLVRLAQGKLSGTSTGMADEDDIASQAFTDFVRSVDEGRFDKLDDRNDLWELLAMIVGRRAIDLHRAEDSPKRGGGMTKVALDGSGSQFVDNNHPVDRAPSPEEAAALVELLKKLLVELKDETHTSVARLLLQNLSQREIAKELGISVSAVNRKTRQIRRTLEDLVRNEDSTS